MVVRKSILSAVCVAGLLSFAVVSPVHAGGQLTPTNLFYVVGGGAIVTVTGTAVVIPPILEPATNFRVINNPSSLTISNLYAGPNVPINTVFKFADVTAPTVEGIYNVTFGFDDSATPANSPAASATITIQVVPEPGTVAFGILAAGSVLGLVARKRKA